MRGRGLKYLPMLRLIPLLVVAPHAGAWIEMIVVTLCRFLWTVAPHAGAWIEIYL